jgi:CRP-like cAMP-binding protein
VKLKKAKLTESLTEVAALSSQELFVGLPAAELRALEKSSERKEFGVGHVLFQPGETGQVLFILEKGRVQTFRNLGERKLIISELQPPAVFGEMGCVGQRMYHCSAQVTENAQIRIIHQPELEGLLRNHPDVTRRLLDLVSQRFVKVLLDLEQMSFKPLLPRLAKLLLDKAKGDAVNNATHKELAEHLRVYRESATMALGELKKAGIIAIERKQIRILDRTRLERASRE